MRPIITATERFILFVLAQKAQPVSTIELYEIIGSSDAKHFNRCCRTLLMAGLIKQHYTSIGRLYSIATPKASQSSLPDASTLDTTGGAQ